MKKYLQEFDMSSLFESLTEEESVDVNYSYAYDPDDEDEDDDDDDEDDYCPKKDDCPCYDDDEDDDDEDDEEDDMEVTHEGKSILKDFKSQPTNVTIVENNGRYYVDMKDIMSYIEAADLDEVEGAVSDIAEANNIEVDDVVIVLPEHAEEIYGEYMMKAMDESSLVFEM